jgi:Ca2+/Na+ antiporter
VPGTIKYMKHQIGISLILFLALMAMVYFAFGIHRIIPIGFQWIYIIVLLTLMVILFLGIVRLFNGTTKFVEINGIVAMLVMATVLIGLYQLSSIRREAEARSFLERNELELKNVVESKKNVEMKMDEFFPGVNTLLIKAKDNYHFELYRFLGYGYGIMFSETKSLEKPGVIRMSPTRQWYKLEDNWYYYSYWD